MNLLFLKFAGSRLRALSALLISLTLILASAVGLARLISKIPEAVFPFPDRSIQLSGMPATFQTAVLPKWKIGQKISLSSNPTAEAVYHSGKSSRLTVVVPGLGGNSTDSMNVWFARPFIKGGDSVLILPSPSHPTFFESHLTSFDFRDANQALCNVVKKFVSGDHFESQKISSVLLAGYSLGGRNVLEMPECLASYFQPRNLSIEVFSMNPPLDLEYAASVLDEALGSTENFLIDDFAKAFSLGLYTKLMAQSFADFDGFENVDEPAIILTARRWTRFLESEDVTTKKGIATLFAYKLRPTVNFVSNAKSEAKSDRFSFRVLTSSRSEARPANTKSLFELIDQVTEQTKGRLFVLHSMDDFLIRTEDLEGLSKHAPEHVLVLPSGGHVGALFSSNYLSGFSRGRRLRIFPSIDNP